MAALNKPVAGSVESIMDVLGVPRADAEAIYARLIGDLDGDVIDLDDAKAAPESDDESRPRP